MIGRRVVIPFPMLVLGAGLLFGLLGWGTQFPRETFYHVALPASSPPSWPSKSVSPSLKIVPLETGQPISDLEAIRAQHVGVSSKPLIWALDETFLSFEDHRSALQQIRTFIQQYGDQVAMVYRGGRGWEDFMAFFQEWLYTYRYLMFPERHVHGQKHYFETWFDLPKSHRPHIFVSSKLDEPYVDWLEQDLGFDQFFLLSTQISRATKAPGR